MFKAVYYWTKSGREPVMEFIEEQDLKAVAKIAENIRYLETEGYRLHRPKAAKISEKLYELRVEFSPNNYRIIYYFCIENRIILLHAFKKKTDKLNKNDIESAETRMSDFNERLKRGEIKWVK